MHKRQCICQGSGFPCILLCSFVQLRLCMLEASIGKPVQSAVFCCPRARGSLIFVVAPFCIPASFLACSSYPSSETQGRLAGARGNKSGKEMKRRRFKSKAEKSFRLTCKLATRTS